MRLPGHGLDNSMWHALSRHSGREPQHVVQGRAQPRRPTSPRARGANQPSTALNSKSPLPAARRTLPREGASRRLFWPGRQLRYARNKMKKVSESAGLHVHVGEHGLLYTLTPFIFLSQAAAADGVERAVLGKLFMPRGPFAFPAGHSMGMHVAVDTLARVPQSMVLPVGARGQVLQALNAVKLPVRKDLMDQPDSYGQAKIG